MMQDVLGMGIETSCDETSVAVIKNGKDILSNVIYSQFDEHARFRGVVPEIASRTHLDKINDVYAEAISEAGISPHKLDYIAVTNRPGLVGSLMIGAQLARSLALVTGKPIVTVDHLEAHFFATCLEGFSIKYPFLGLLISGGNTAIFKITGPGELECVADTMDDALGEAFDKAATVLALPYPGGPVIEKLAAGYEHAGSKPSLFTPLLKKLPESRIAFSFSGIKTAVIRAARSGEDPAQIAHDFQATAFELIIRMLRRAVNRTGIRHIIASGGVLANSRLRETLKSQAQKEGWQMSYPESRKLCTDNGGMTAALGYHHYRMGNFAPLDFSVAGKR